MANDFFGGLMKGLSGLMPQDDPNVQLMQAQSELSELQEQEEKLYAEIGRRACTEHPGQYPEVENKLKLVQTELAAMQGKLKQAQQEKEEREKKQKIKDENRTCPQCGSLNPEGVKFCQECGAKLGEKKYCLSCGAPINPGVRFCGECGAGLGE